MKLIVYPGDPAKSRAENTKRYAAEVVRLQTRVAALEADKAAERTRRSHLVAKWDTKLRAKKMHGTMRKHLLSDLG